LDPNPEPAKSFGFYRIRINTAKRIHIFDPSIQILYMLNRSSPPVLPDLWFRGGGREAQTEDGLL
jgi:hypothetical protein